jgi:hypothetical protein
VVVLKVQEQPDGRDVNLQIRFETFNVCNVRIYGAANTDPRSPELRHRRHVQPGELPADDADWGAVVVLGRWGQQAEIAECRLLIVD